MICRSGAKASVRRFTVGEGEGGVTLDDFRRFVGGVLEGEGVLTTRKPVFEGDGERLTGGGNIDCLPADAAFKLATLAERVTLFAESAGDPSGDGDLRFRGEEEGVW
jgi:hypothetical protein